MSVKVEAQVKAIREGLQQLVLRLEEIEKAYKEMPATAKAELEFDPKTLNNLPWRPYKKGNGSWIFANTKGAEKLVELVKESPAKKVPIGDFEYRLSHGESADFLSRRPIK